MHCHIHLNSEEEKRYKNPRGRVSAVIPRGNGILNVGFDHICG